MKKLAGKLLVGALSVCLLCGAAFGANQKAEKGAVKGWAFTVQSAPCGSVKVFLGSDILQMEFLKTGNVLLAAGPNWDVQIYNLKSKRSYSCPNAAWTGGSLQKYLQVMCRSPRDLIWVKQGDGKNGLVDFVADKPATDLSAESRKRVDRLVGKGRLKVNVSAKLPSACFEILNRTLGCPSVAGIPVSMITTDQTRKPTRFVELSGSITKLSVERQSFDLPKGLTAVDSDTKLGGSSAEDFINELAE